MRIISGLPQSRLAPCALALGNFDGVHQGHRAVLSAALAAADRLDVASAVAVFAPHPRRYFNPDLPPFRLMGGEQQADVLRTLGFDRLHILPFDKRMASMMPREFAETVLMGWSNVRHVCVGADFEFGKGRSGDVPILTGIGEQMGFGVTGADLQAAGDTKISSSGIRQHLADGELADANRLLGDRWRIRGVVEVGDQRGRTIGFPTANISLGDYTRPKFGVYAVRIFLKDSIYDGVANVGRRPTVGGETERLEVHLFEFAGDIYGEALEIEFHTFLRPEQKFDGLEALKAQIAKDAQSAKDVLAGHGWPPSRQPDKKDK